MLQQTQVSRVILYFNNFMLKFPTVKQLAKASVEDVLGQWKGLGYYSRAKNMHRAAQEIVANFDGEFPNSVDELMSLPGFGRYTAGAVASIAMNHQVPLVDGNVARVLSRIFEIDLAPEDKARDKQLWALADQLVQGKEPGNFNQSLMELGATVCTPSSPTCESCPVSKWCLAKQHERVHEIPRAKIRAKVKVMSLVSVFIKNGNKVLLGRRKESGLFGGLWELPAVEVKSAAAARKYFATCFPSDFKMENKQLAHVSRTLTHREFQVTLYEGQMKSMKLKPFDPYVEMKFVPLNKLNQLAISSAQKALWDSIGLSADSMELNC
jgi:A/G-specific adenine glycosylase